MVHRMSIDKLLQRENKGRKRKEIKMEKFTPLFIPYSHKCICEYGLSGQRHFGNFADVDGLRDLQAVIVLNVRWRIARRSRPPQINISEMPLTDQEKKAKITQEAKTDICRDTKEA